MNDRTEMKTVGSKWILLQFDSEQEPCVSKCLRCKTHSVFVNSKC